MLAIGIMTGTSLDGIDIALCDIEGVDDSTKIKFLYGKTFPYPSDVLLEIQKAVHNQAIVSDIAYLNFRLAEVYSDSVKKLINESNYSMNDIQFISSHGQTVYHQGKSDDKKRSSTLQLGSGAVLAELAQTTVISNFREHDMAQGGQGAPLIPFVDKVLFYDKNKNRIIHNIGGISNISLITKKDEVIAFDTGPGNMLINAGMEYLYQKSFDDKGLTARKGKLIQPLFEILINHPFYNEKPPKSCGREQFGLPYLEKIIHPFLHERKEDIIHTITYATVYTMADAIKRYIYVESIDELIVSGGGVKNTFLMELLQKLLTPIKVISSDELGVSSDFKEAIGFVILGNQVLNQRPNTLISATGAKKQVIGGSIQYYFKGENHEI